jgi:hypothetical protein
MRTLLLFISLVLAVPGLSQEKSVTLATLNCYWFFNGDEGKASADKPTSTLEYNTKAAQRAAFAPYKTHPIPAGTSARGREQMRVPHEMEGIS